MNRARFLIQIAAIYGVIGAFMGGHMAGSGGYILRTIHAHILAVGWLSLFAFAIFYAVFKIPKDSKLANLHVWSAFLGSIGLTSGMWMYYSQPAWSPEIFSLIYFILGGTILMVSFLVFLIITFKHGEYIKDKS
ncbi:hypothetical protein ACERII_06605 [Evansella sp. AB-rgal1]|uniref:hypothetical protein n=1 Tax=Evansella sp. AB-rgal1 TaxID=3242696 RepID=UPI00359DDDAA